MAKINVIVPIGRNAFEKESITISVGDTVTWSNESTHAHTVTPDDPGEGWEKGGTLNRQGDTYSHTFSKAGEFSYFCQFHPGMVGDVTVK